MAIRYLPGPVIEEPIAPQPPALVVFGRDRGGKPRAAWFDGHQAEAATAVATSMKLRVLPVTDDDQRALALQLAHGRLLPSGKAHVPGARRDLYGRLVALAGDSAGLSVAEPVKDEAGNAVRPADAKGVTAEAERPTPVPSPGAREATPNASPLSIGGAPAAKAEAEGEGAAKPRPGDRNFVGNPMPRDRDEIGLGSVVLAHEGADDGWWEAEVIGINGRVFSLRWRDYPLQPTILRKAGELALLPPGEA